MEPKTLKNDQYKTDRKFSARILIHTKYGINKTPWPIWLFSQYELGEDEKIIEFGCGNGLLWKVNAFRINPKWEITLSDFSSGMVDAAQNYIGDACKTIQYKVLDLNTITNTEKYTTIIANHMLYHIEQKDRTLKTLSEILDNNGTLYASTVGINDMKEMNEIISEFTGNNNYKIAKGSITDNFSLENGSDQLNKHFPYVSKKIYEDSLEITSAEDFTNYVISCNDLKPGNIVLAEREREDFKKYIEQIIERKGQIHITKSSGTFIAKK